MIHYKEVQETRNEIKFKECDKCHKKFDINNVDDVCEMQEFLHFRNTGGYGSIFGDEAKIELDLCQHCTKEVLGQYLRVGPDWLEVEAEKWEKNKEKKEELAWQDYILRGK